MELGIDPSQLQRALFLLNKWNAECAHSFAEAVVTRLVMALPFDVGGVSVPVDSATASGYAIFLHLLSTKF